MPRPLRLPTFPGAECRVSCGCRVMLGVGRFAPFDDTKIASLHHSPAVLIVAPCEAGREHMDLAERFAAEGATSPAELAAAMEDAVR